MKRLVQAIALLQLFLVVALGVRMVRVWSTPLPEFGEIPELPATAPLPPPKPPPKVTEAVTTDIVEHDLFDEVRGQGEEITVEGPVDLTPVPPPTTVKLMGVMMLGSDPIGILLDPSVRPEQQSVRKGEMFGEYEIGDISPFGLTLLGTGGQHFQIPLRVEAAAAGAAPPPPPRPANAPGSARAPATPATRPVTARPAMPKNDNAAAPEQKVMSARERAQAIAQRNADLRKNAAQRNDEAEEGQKGKGGAPDPVQARLEALRQLREAAKSR